VEITPKVKNYLKDFPPKVSITGLKIDRPSIVFILASGKLYVKQGTFSIKIWTVPILMINKS